MFLIDERKSNQYVLVGGNPTSTTKVLDKGVYNFVVTSQGPMSQPIISFEKTTKYENGMNIEGGVFTQARQFLNNFVKPELYEARKEMKMMHKIGVIFDGKPGTGKTFLAGQIANYFAEKYNAIGIISTDHETNYPALIDQIREFDEDRLIVLVMDEFEKSKSRFWSEMLSFLDGSDSRNNVIIIATINDRSELPSYIKDRPGRFEKSFEFKPNDETVLKSIITQCIPDKFKKDFDVSTLVKDFTNKANAKKFGLSSDTDDFTVDRLRINIRDLVANKIIEKQSPKALTCQPDLAKKAQANVN